MKNLGETLRIATASVFHYGLLVHTAHFNVVGPRFYELHLLFERIYTDVESSFDSFGEQIRSLDVYCPAGLEDYLTLSILDDQHKLLPAQKLIHSLLINNDKIINILNEVNVLSDNYPGLQNFIQGRIEAHEKHGWMMRATII
jgi:starvation-inducible DNA-binding protein